MRRVKKTGMELRIIRMILIPNKEDVLRASARQRCTVFFHHPVTARRSSSNKAENSQAWELRLTTLPRSQKHVAGRGTLLRVGYHHNCYPCLLFDATKDGNRSDRFPLQAVQVESSPAMKSRTAILSAEENLEVDIGLIKKPRAHRSHACTRTKRRTTC